MAIGDVAGSPAPDVLVSALSPPRVALLVGDGQGGLGEASALPTEGSGHDGIEVTDLDADGHLDVVVVNTGSHDFTSMLGDGRGQFGVLRSFGTGGLDPTVPAVADFDGDGVPDVAVPNGGPGSNSVGVRLGSGDGSFGDLGVHTSGGSNPSDVVAADLDLDGDPDLASTNMNSGNVGLLVGERGAFQPAQPLAVGPAPGAIAAGDLNGDGADDLAVGDLATGDVHVYLNDPTDVTPPVLSLPEAIVADATGPDGASVDYEAAASDDLDPSPELSCEPRSGAIFEIGVTVVSCVATDGSGNESRGEFDVTVRGAADQLGDVAEALGGLGLTGGGVRSLLNKLEGAQEAVAQGSPSACRKLEGFIGHLLVQSGKALPAGDAVELIAASERVRDVLACN